jgi:hypothetical protein
MAMMPVSQSLHSELWSPVAEPCAERTNGYDFRTADPDSGAMVSSGVGGKLAVRSASLGFTSSSFSLPSFPGCCSLPAISFFTIRYRVSEVSPRATTVALFSCVSINLPGARSVSRRSVLGLSTYLC